MYEKLLDFAGRKPEVYAGSTSKFWDDEHISKYMLKAHLDPETEGASRRHDFIRRSAGWIAQVSGGGKKLLDLGCGAGIYAEAFCGLGFSVTGVDLARRSVDYAAEQAVQKNLDITYRCQNYLKLEYEQDFDVATLIFCDFGVMEPGDRALLLGKIRRALRPGGTLVLDGFTEAQYAAFTEERTVVFADGGFWSPHPYLCIQSNYRYDDSKTYLEQYLIVTEHECQCFHIWNQAFSPETLGAELRAAGFTELQFYDDVGGARGQAERKTLCVVAR